MSISEITVEELAAVLEAGGRVLDVRNPDEYTGGHVPGAISIPLATVPDNVDAFRGDGPAYVICKVGGRSMSACAYLMDHGVEAINVAGGTDGWIQSGRPVVTGEEPV